MKYTSLKNINEYKSEIINPTKSPDMIFEMYSVPIFETGHPEYLRGCEIGSSKALVQKNDVLLCKINPRINRVWVVSDESIHPNIASSEWIVVRNKEYNPEFLAWYFRSPKFKRLMTSEVTGIGGSLTRAQPKTVAKYPVPVLPRQAQDNITCVLNTVNGIILSRKQEIQKLETLIKARFVELFGDPRRNECFKWGLKDFKDITELITDGEHATPRRVNKGIYLLSARNVLNHSLQLTDVDYIDQEEYDRIAKRIIPKEGDVLVSCSGSVGRCCSVPSGIQFQMVRSAALLRFSSFVLPVFAEYMITSDFVQEQINQSKTASSQANLFQGKIAKLKGFVPPIELQEQFATFVAQVDKSKIAVQKSLDETQLLFDSLMQQYFG